MSADFSDAYNAAAARYSGNLDADLSDYGIPADLANEVAAVCCAWATKRRPAADDRRGACVPRRSDDRCRVAAHSMTGAKRTEGEPDSRLARMAHAMTEALETHPENTGTVLQAVVLIHDDSRATAHFWGYDDDRDAFDDMLQFLEKLGRTNGIELQFVEVGGG